MPQMVERLWSPQVPSVPVIAEFETPSVSLARVLEVFDEYTLASVLNALLAGALDVYFNDEPDHSTIYLLLDDAVACALEPYPESFARDVLETVAQGLESNPAVLYSSICRRVAQPYGHRNRVTISVTDKTLARLARAYEVFALPVTFRSFVNAVLWAALVDQAPSEVGHA